MKHKGIILGVTSTPTGTATCLLMFEGDYRYNLRLEDNRTGKVRQWKSRNADLFHGYAYDATVCQDVEMARQGFTRESPLHRYEHTHDDGLLCLSQYLASLPDYTYIF